MIKAPTAKKSMHCKRPELFVAYRRAVAAEDR